jgi:Zn-dependent protease
MGLFKLLLQNPLAFLLIAITLLYSIILHELAHGWVAYQMGDPTAKRLGRLSLNPLKHLEPIGTLMLFLVGFGWAKPVPVNFNLLRNRHGAMIAVAAAGVTANMLVAFTAMLLDRLLAPSPSGLIGAMLYYVAHINIILAALNLIPLPPLDGSKILMGFASPRVQNALLRIEPYGFFILIGLLLAGALDPIILFFRWLILSVINLAL